MLSVSERLLDVRTGRAGMGSDEDVAAMRVAMDGAVDENHLRKGFQQLQCGIPRPNPERNLPLLVAQLHPLNPLHGQYFWPRKLQAPRHASLCI